MTWLKIDDGFAEHPKVIELSDGAFRLHVMAMCYAARHETDGRIGSGTVGAIWPRFKKAVTELVNRRLWEELPGGYAIHDWLEYNPTSEEARERRSSLSAIRAEAGRRGGLRSGEARRQFGLPGDPEMKNRARTELTMAINRGEIIPQPCEKCGTGFAEGHHPDYSKPLLVKWLCKAHHDAEHVAIRKANVSSKAAPSGEQIVAIASSKTKPRPVPSQPDPIPESSLRSLSARELAEAEKPVEVREMRDALLSKLPSRYQHDPGTIEALELFATDFSGQWERVNHALDECRREGNLPFPGNLRKALKEPGKEPNRGKARRSDGLDDLRAAGLVDIVE